LSQLEEYERFLDNMRRDLRQKLIDKINKLSNNIKSIENSLDTFNLTKNMNNGYAVVIKGYKIIDSCNDIKSGQKLKIKMKDGEVNVVVV
jgi:exodeoxyribonuclease VII large subunit